MSNPSSFAESLARLTVAGELFRTPDDDPTGSTVQCLACAHQCRIAEGRHGICQVRRNRGGRLLVPDGYVSSVACDPIEKKPFYHFLAGQDAFSFGMLGCNLHCPFCQNWHISQALRDPQAVINPRRCTAADLVAAAQSHGARCISSTYNEPLITSEWAAKVFRLAKAQGLLTCYVSNGYASEAVLHYLDPCLDAMNVDLKCFSEEGYARLGGRLQPVCDTIRRLYESGKWVEVITLLVPGFNDSEAELRQLTAWLASVSVDIPWHVTAYHPDYKMATGPRRTSAEGLLTAIEIGRAAGLRYVYGGNAPGLGRYEHTYCHACGKLLVERHGFTVRQDLIRAGTCPACDAVIPGRWRI